MEWGIAYFQTSFINRRKGNGSSRISVARRPQFGLSCGHSVCENCVRVFGNKNDLNPWVYHVDQCFICGAGVGSLAIRVRPENASIRVLSIDGGGVRGVAPLQFLRTLQDQLRLPNYPIQRHFDLIYGTSSGECICSHSSCIVTIYHP